MLPARLPLAIGGWVVVWLLHKGDLPAVAGEDLVIHVYAKPDFQVVDGIMVEMDAECFGVWIGAIQYEVCDEGQVSSLAPLFSTPCGFKRVAFKSASFLVRHDEMKRDLWEGRHSRLRGGPHSRDHCYRHHSSAECHLFCFFLLHAWHIYTQAWW